MTQADGRVVPGPHGASDALGHNPKIFRLALTQLSINPYFTHNDRTASYNSAVATIVERVESWYGKHLDYLKTPWAALTIRSHEPADPVHGKVEIRAESSTVAASVTFWNKGDVTVIRLDLPQKRDSVMDDRKLSPSEDIALLLDSYFRALASPAG